MSFFLRFFTQDNIQQSMVSCHVRKSACGLLDRYHVSIAFCSVRLAAALLRDDPRVAAAPQLVAHHVAHALLRVARTSARSFFKHHTQQLAAAAQVGDAKGIRRKITQMKIRLMKDVLKAGGRA